MPGALELPPISTSVLADVEQAAVSLGVTRDQMTEAAARAAAALARKILDNEMAGATVVGLCGNGVKGCVALHTLRILHGFGADCSAVLAGGEREMRPETAAAASVCEALRLPLLQPRSPSACPPRASSRRWPGSSPASCGSATSGIRPKRWRRPASTAKACSTRTSWCGCADRARAICQMRAS